MLNLIIQPERVHRIGDSIILSTFFLLNLPQNRYPIQTHHRLAVVTPVNYERDIIHVTSVFHYSEELGK